MEFLNILLPILLYIFGIILLIVLIILGIRTIELLNKIDRLTDDITEKVSTLDNLFGMIDKATDSISFISDKIVSTISGYIMGLIKRKDRDENE